MQTITTFRNPLTDPVGTRRGPPLVRGPQFENRWVSLSQSIHTYTAHIDEQSTLAVNTCHLNGPSTQVAWTGARESGPSSWLSETAVLTVREHGYTARWHECSVHITRVCGASTRLSFWTPVHYGWARVQIAVATLSGNSLRQTVHIRCASVHQAAKLVAALLRVAGVTAGNGSLPPGLWLTSPAGWLPRTGISSGTLRLVIDYGLPLPFLHYGQPHSRAMSVTNATQPCVL